MSSWQFFNDCIKTPLFIMLAGLENEEEEKNEDSEEIQ